MLGQVCARTGVRIVPNPAEGVDGTRRVRSVAVLLMLARTGRIKVVFFQVRERKSEGDGREKVQ